MVPIQRVLAVCLAAALLLVPGPMGSALEPVSGSAAANAVDGSTPQPGPRVVRFDGPGDRHVSSSARSSARLSVRRWNTTRIPYVESLPAAWDWSLRTAIAQWNTTGAGIRFVRVTERRRARLVIGYGDIGAAAGRATIGPARPAWVKLSNAYRDVDAQDAFNRVAVMAVLAHELGHVLGFGHRSGTCSLMASTLNFEDCGVLPSAHPGYYKCQIIDLPLVREQVRVYGGSVRAAGGLCLIAPLPPALDDLRFTGGGDREVELSWTPRSLPTGTRAELRITPGGCGSPTGPATTVAMRPAAGLWRDVLAPSTGVHCFAVRTVNHYGAGRPWVSATRTRWASLTPPTIGDVRWDGHAFAFGAYAPEGVIKFVRDREHPETCPTTVGETIEDLQWTEDGRALFTPEVANTCLALFAVVEDGRRSPLVFVRLAVSDFS